MSLKYKGYTVVFQEVPGEVSLAINISGCTHRCHGCHSQYLWEDSGDSLLGDLPSLLEAYDELITCVCFMGGDQDPFELKGACKIVQDAGLKTCLYTGLDSLGDVQKLGISHCFDYLKVGHYDETKGGLSSRNTNQRFYAHHDNSYQDITNLFWRNNIAN